MGVLLFNNKQQPYNNRADDKTLFSTSQNRNINCSQLGKMIPVTGKTRRKKEDEGVFSLRFFPIK